MATIRPFRGVRYNPEKIDDLSTVISQPYDRVRHGLQDKYYAQSPYTIVRIIKGKEGAGDNKENNVYTRARDYYQSWLRDGILMREQSPALYVLHQTTTLADGSTKTRKGLIAALELSRFDEGIVLPHERTHSGPKVDRLNLMRATEVNFGHIFMLYPEGRINALLDAAIEGQPGLELRELFEHDVVQQFWAVTDPDVIRAVVEEMAPRRNLIIADGHHRYETAITYRDEMRAQHPDAPANAGFNYRLVTLVSMEDPGLVILPTHRLIRSYDQMSGQEALEKAKEYFEVSTVADRAALEAALAEAVPSHPRFGLYDGAYAVITLQDPAALEKLLPEHSSDWRLLDVSVLHELFIERVMGMDKAVVEAKTNIEYLRDPQMGYDAVDEGAANFLLLMNPTRMEQVQVCTGAGEKMPQKSTDFFPKVIGGLVMMPIGVEERL
ncbi:MAG: DUF1015 domain-containing protein [Chloroflexi bacterium]|nr:MAG: DUF1015 domain-containing protein [Chloroflexota bacterium]RLC86766.1 MAG: DUF1015 domain-containing protein [Chloroflexota bacterium]